jgi:hypothetical protein
VQTDHCAAELLLSAIESPYLQISGAAMRGFPAQVRNQMLATGLVVPDGHEAIATSDTDHEDRPVSLAWSDPHQAFGYFSSLSGWIIVSHDDVRVFKINLTEVISSLTSKFGMARRVDYRVLVPDLLWEVGACRFGRRNRRTVIMFGRRLSDPCAWQLIQRALAARSAQDRRLILTSTQPARLPDQHTADTIVSVHDLLGDGLVLDRDSVAARFDQIPISDSREAIVLLADGKEVSFFGQTFRFPKGVNQRRIIKLLYARYRVGQHRVSVDEVISILGLRENARIRDYFKGHPAWGQMLTEHDGTCGFRLEYAQPR